MRKGYTIIEIIWLTALFALLVMLTAKPIRILMSDVSRSQRDFQTAASLHYLLGCLKMDIEAAKEIKIAGDPNTLIIVGGQTTTTYRFTNEQVRCTNSNDPDFINLWQLPHIRLEWKIRNHNSLQITAWLERTVLGRTEKKFHNSHLFYAKGLVSGEAQ